MDDGPEGRLHLRAAPRRLEIRSDINRMYFDRWLALKRRPFGWLQMQTLVARFQRRFLEYGYTLRGLQGDGLA